MFGELYYKWKVQDYDATNTAIFSDFRLRKGGGMWCVLSVSHSSRLLDIKLEYKGRLMAVQLGLCWMTVPSHSKDIKLSLFATGVCLLKMHGWPCQHCTYAWRYAWVQKASHVDLADPPPIQTDWVKLRCQLLLSCFMSDLCQIRFQILEEDKSNRGLNEKKAKLKSRWLHHSTTNPKYEWVGVKEKKKRNVCWKTFFASLVLLYSPHIEHRLCFLSNLVPELSPPAALNGFFHSPKELTREAFLLGLTPVIY